MTGGEKLSLPLRTLNFSPDGKLIYFTQTDVDAVQALDPATQKVVGQIPVGASPHLVLFTDDGEYALAVSQKSGELAILNRETNKVEATVAVGKNPHWVALTPDDRLAYVTNEASNDVSVVDIEAKKVLTTIAAGQAPRGQRIIRQPACGKQDDGNVRGYTKPVIATRFRRHYVVPPTAAWIASASRCRRRPVGK